MTGATGKQWSRLVIEKPFGRDHKSAVELNPGQNAIFEKRRMILSVKGGNPDVERITMTMPLINNARKLLCMVTGGKKANTVRSVLKFKDLSLPATMVGDKRTTWLLDGAAASLIL